MTDQNVGQQMPCQRCSAFVPASNRFCNECGQPVSTAIASTEYVVDVPVVAAEPHAGPPVGASVWQETSPRALYRLATRIDSWGDVIDTLGERAAQLREAFQARMLAQGLPSMGYEVTRFGIGADRRKYLVIRPLHRGGRVTVYITEFGQNLYIAWDMWLTRAIRWPVILGMLGVSFLFGPIVISLVVIATVLGSRSVSNLFWFVVPIAVFCVNFFLLTFLLGYLGRMVRNDPLAFFVAETNDFEIQDLRALLLTTHYTLLQSADAVGIDVSRLRAKEKFGSDKLGSAI